MQCRTFRTRFLLMVMFLVRLSLAAQGQAKQETVPNWMAWHAFQSSLAYYNGRSSEQLRHALGEEFGLSSSEVTELLNAGQTYLATMKRIEDAASAEVQARYGTVLQPARVVKTRPSGPPQSIRQLAIDSGLDAQVNAKKETALSNHLNRLQSGLRVAQFEQLSRHVQSVVVPHVKWFPEPNANTRVRGLPPGLKRDASPKVR